MRNFLKISIIALIGLLFIYAIIIKRGNSNKNNSNHVEEKVFPVKLSKLIIKEITYSIGAVGSFLPEDEVMLNSEIEGKIKRTIVDEGDEVKKGDIMLELDNERIILEINEKEAKLKQAKLDYENLKRKLERNKKLFEEGIIDKQSYDDITTKVSLALAKIENLEASLNLSKKDLKDTKVLAPISGIVTKRFVSVGEYIKKDKSLFSIVNYNPIKLRFTIPEVYAKNVKIGQKVVAKVKAYPDRIFSGKIYYINPKIEETTRNIEIKARIDNNNMLLKPGFFAEVSLITGINKNAKLIPEEAIINRENHNFVFVVKDNIAHKRAVKIGKRMKGMVEIVDGINEDDAIVIRGGMELADGARVKILRG
jgi:membrane fusion protein (multidrug efflux system)